MDERHRPVGRTRTHSVGAPPRASPHPHERLRCKYEDGNYIKFNANIAVIMATDDYQNDWPWAIAFVKPSYSATLPGL